MPELICTRCRHPECKGQSEEFPVCQFCEDGVACPGAMREEREAKKVVANLEPKSRAPKETKESEAVMNLKDSNACACGCGEPASRNRLYAWGHKPKDAKPSKPGAVRKASKAKPKREEALKDVAVVDNAVATICVTEERLNHFLTTLPLETKAQIASEYLGRN